MLGENPIYFSGLNGLRAICAFSVVFSHISIRLDVFNLPSIFQNQSLKNENIGLDLASFGVTIFFVISGFLINFLLLKEKDKKEINIKKFYYRRILRIWPLYYLYFALATVSILVQGSNFQIDSFFYYVFYAANIPFILGATLPYLAHFWSLGVEEQFYLFWPWIVKKTKNLKEVVLWSILFLFALKFCLYFYDATNFWYQFMRVSRFDCILIGVYGSILYKENSKSLIQLLDNKFAQIVAWTTLIIITFNQFNISEVVNHEIVSLVALTIITGQINRKNRIINLELSVFNFFGKLSYGIYVIHPIIIGLLSKLPISDQLPIPFKYLLVYLLVYVISIVLSYLSYRYFEAYFMRQKMKFVVVESKSENTNFA
jgi:peptidoglycan/LPS O-acetylase OafA/YrhL